MSNDFSVAIIVSYCTQAGSPTIAGTTALRIIVIRFTKETADCLHNQFSPAVVVDKAFVVRGPAFSDFPATGIMDIYTEWQSQTEEAFPCQAHPLLCYMYRFFRKARQSVRTFCPSVKVHAFFCKELQKRNGITTH